MRNSGKEFTFVLPVVDRVTHNTDIIVFLPLHPDCSFPHITHYTFKRQASIMGTVECKFNFANEKVVKLVVGESGVEFLVHQSLLENSSNFFKAALSPESSFKEANELTVALPEDEVDVITHYVHWLYWEAVSELKLSVGQPNILVEIWKS